MIPQELHTFPVSFLQFRGNPVSTSKRTNQQRATAKRYSLQAYGGWTKSCTTLKPWLKPQRLLAFETRGIESFPRISWVVRTEDPVPRFAHSMAQKLQHGLPPPGAPNRGIDRMQLAQNGRYTQGRLISLVFQIRYST